MVKSKNSDLVAKYLDHIKTEKNLSEGTITTYTNIARTLDFSIMLSQRVLIKKLKDLYTNPNTLQLYLNMLILIRRYNDEPTDLLVKLRNGLRDEISKIRRENLTTLDDTLPSHEYLTEQLGDTNGVRYIINYLIINHALRNKDLNLKIVGSEKDMDDQDQNYMVISKRKKLIKLFINDYKTEKTHGTKKFEVSDLDFYKNVVAQGPGHLFQLKSGRKVKNPSTFNDRVQHMTIDRLGQNKMVKIVIKDLLNTKAFDKLEQLSRDRGTSMAVLLKSYNLYAGEK